jgi:nicotinate phosphoribosyltransferase
MVSFPRNNFITPLLTDLYEVTMAYVYFREGRHLLPATFELFFRKNPFQGEYTVFAGLTEVLRFVQEQFRFTEEHTAFLKSHEAFANTDQLDAFLAFLQSEACSGRSVQIRALPEGSVCFPLEPLLRVDGPLAVCQLLETTLLTLVNFPSLVATNAARHRVAVGERVQLIEFGLRRAQGPDGGMSASRYAYLGGFDGTSNVMAAYAYGIPCRGTHAHAFVQSFAEAGRLQDGETTASSWGTLLASLAHEYRERVIEPILRESFQVSAKAANGSELRAFIAYATAFPNAFLALVDTYDSLGSGIPNFLAVALALEHQGYKPLGVRIDSGDLAYISTQARRMFDAVNPGNKYMIFASSEIHEDTLYALKEQGHAIDAFGVGTHLVTCQKQPALGCVFKLVQVGQVPCIKVSEDPSKTTIPGRKRVYRLYGRDPTVCMIDLMMLETEPEPRPGERILCCHPFEEHKRCYMTPSRVEEILQPLSQDDSGAGEDAVSDHERLRTARQRCLDQVRALRYDYKRPLNPTPYKVSVSAALFELVHQLWLSELAIRDLS